jgi:hypothetical protein
MLRYIGGNQLEGKRRRAEANRESRYGLSPKVFKDLLEKQGGKCAICPGATIMADDNIKRIPFKDLHQEEGAHELATSPDMEQMQIPGNK